ncbi:MAG: hypothetical protein ACMG6E_01995, partial [Candidatus Roizmanbacteria bacterium]
MKFFKASRTGEIATLLTVASFAIMIVGLVAGTQYSKLLQSQSNATGQAPTGPFPTLRAGERGTNRYREIYKRGDAKSSKNPLQNNCRAGFMLIIDPTTTGYIIMTASTPTLEFRMENVADKFGNKPGQYTMFAQRNSAQVTFDPGKDIELTIRSTDKSTKKQQIIHHFFYDRSSVPWLDAELAKNNVIFRVEYKLKNLPQTWHQDSELKGLCNGETVTPEPGTGTPIETETPGPGTGTPILTSTIVPPPPCGGTTVPTSAVTPGVGTGTPVPPCVTATPKVTDALTPPPCYTLVPPKETPGPGTGTPPPPCVTVTPVATITPGPGTGTPIPTAVPPTKITGLCPLRVKSYVKICKDAKCKDDEATITNEFDNKIDPATGYAYYGAINDKQKLAIDAATKVAWGDKPWAFAPFGHPQDNSKGLIASGIGEIWFGTTNFTGAIGYVPGSRAIVTGYFNADKYKIDHVSCGNLPSGTTLACPGVTKGAYTAKSTLYCSASTLGCTEVKGGNPDPLANDWVKGRIDDLLLDCNTDYEYGWYLLPKNITTPPNVTPEPTKADGPGTKDNKLYQLDLESTNFGNLTNPCFVVASDKDGKLDQAPSSSPMPCIRQEISYDSASKLVKTITVWLQNVSQSKNTTQVHLTLNTCPDKG